MMIKFNQALRETVAENRRRKFAKLYFSFPTKISRIDPNANWQHIFSITMNDRISRQTQ